MSRPADRPADHRTVRRVVLPSGKTIEVLYFDAQPVAPAPAPAEPASAPAGSPSPAPAPAASAAAPAIETVEGLHVCPSCASKLVSPVAWEEAGPEHWDVTLHCPNCDWLGSGVFDEELVERFDEELDRGTEALVRDLQRLMRANMEDEIDRFVAALAADQIWPMDF